MADIMLAPVGPEVFIQVMNMNNVPNQENFKVLLDITLKATLVAYFRRENKNGTKIQCEEPIDEDRFFKFKISDAVFKIEKLGRDSTFWKSLLQNADATIPCTACRVIK